MVQVDLLRSPQAWFLMVVGLAWYAYTWMRKGKAMKNKPAPSPPAAKTQETEFSEDLYYQIEPLTDLDLENTEPEKLRPFNPKYYLTMAIQNIKVSDLIPMDKTYPQRLALRKQLLKTNKPDVLAYTPVIEPAVQEFYTWITKTYLPTRFPTLFSLTPDALFLKNHTTNALLPLTPSSTDAALQTLGENIDNDFLFLLPVPKSDTEKASEEGKYRLEGFITCFPSGFETAKKLGLTLSDIHGPVPNYKEKLEKSMDRFFSTLQVGRVIKRHNWSVTTTRDLFLLSGAHMGPEDVPTATSTTAHPAKEEEEDEEVDLDKTVMRCERQTLHRLPHSKAIIFSYKTYQYGLRELRDEGVGEEMAEASLGLGKGNAAGMRVYKREVVWGEKVRAFLKGEGV